MPTFLFSEHVFGPIKSRRLGSSLGINLLSTKEKVCNYNCVYCECGLTTPLQSGKEAFVDKRQLLDTLKNKLIHCQINCIPIDTITFAGNGEPTLHPNFLFITQKIVDLRNEFFPKAKIAVLTNGLTLDKIRVRKALELVDKAIIKLDAGTEESIELIDQPKGSISIDKLINNIRQFKGETVIQTMFLKGEINEVSFDNTSEQEILTWLDKLILIKPKEVMIYSIDRDTPIDTLEKIDKEELNKIALRVEKLGFQTQVV